MKHLWVLDEDFGIICAVCGMEKEEWKKTGKPPCRGKLPIPEDYRYTFL